MDDAKKVISDASKKNGRYIVPDEIVLTAPTSAGSKGGFTDIIQHPKFLIHTLIMYFNWFTTSFIMYGLAVNGQITGGLFRNFLIGTILDFPAKTVAMILVQFVGRKYPYIFCSIFTGLIFFLIMLMPPYVYPYNLAITVLAFIGNFSTTMCLAILYIYTGLILFI